MEVDEIMRGIDKVDRQQVDRYEQVGPEGPVSML